MDSRERFRRTMTYGSPDRATYWEDPFWYESTLDRWRSEGLGAKEHPNDIFGLEPRFDIPIDYSVNPKYERIVIENNDEFRIIRNTAGVTLKILKSAKPPAMPQFLDFPVKSHADYADIKTRLKGHDPVRYPADWPQKAAEFNRRDHPLGIHCGSFFGWMRDWMGLEALCMNFIDEPAMMHEAIEFIADFVIDAMRKALKDVKPDYAWFWEDMAYKTASLVSPGIVKKFMLPQYRRIVDVLHGAGVDIIMLDSDGNVDELIPLWLETGINCIYPMEVAAGMDVIALRRKYGRDLLMVGGVDKREIAKGKREIDAEINRIAPLVADGGYIPTIDHAVPPDISYENFTYYRRSIEKISKTGGI